MSPNKIKLVLIGGVWHAEHYGPYADKVRELFGTYILPTPFLENMPLWQVKDELKNQNPNYDII